MGNQPIIRGQQDVNKCDLHLGEPSFIHREALNQTEVRPTLSCHVPAILEMATLMSRTNLTEPTIPRLLPELRTVAVTCFEASCVTRS